MTSLKHLKKNIPPLPQSMWRNPLHFIAFGFGSGALPIAPGTFGTLIAIPFYLLLKPLPLIFYIGVVFLITIA
jgi:phosphatidylglycerophosphatase A